MRPRPLTAALLAVTLMLAAPLEVAASPEVRKVGVAVDGDGRIRISSGLRDVFSTKVRDKMRSGLPTRIAIQMTVERRGSRRALAYWARSVEVTYDLWKEHFSIIIEDDHGRRRTRVDSVDEAVGIGGTLWRVPVTGTENLEPGQYRVRVRAEANPVSEEMVENIRRWLARSSADPGGATSSESRSNYFGSFVGVFVDRRIGRADKRVTFVSQWFEVAAR